MLTMAKGARHVELYNNGSDGQEFGLGHVAVQSYSHPSRLPHPSDGSKPRRSGDRLLCAH